jgi:hypothetical protein
MTCNEDQLLPISALQHLLFEHDLSAVSGEMNARKLVVFEREPKTT